MSRLHAEQEYAAGQQLLMQGMLEDAVDAFHRVLNAQPAHVGALHALGVLARHFGKPDAAEVLLSEARKHAPNDGRILNDLGLMLEGKGRKTRAAAYYRAAQRGDPQSGDAFFNLGNLLLDQSRMSAALHNYHQALEILGERADILYNCGLAYQQLGRSAEARDAYQRALALEPDMTEALVNLGVIELGAGDFSTAKELLLRAVSLNPAHAVAMRHIGAAFARAGDAQGGAGVLEQMALVAENQGRVDDAIRCYQGALQLVPRSATVRYNLGRLHAHRGDHVAARKALSEAVHLDPAFFEAHVNLGVLLRMTGEPAAAAASLREALALRPGDPTVLNSLGNALGDLSELEEAIACYREAVTASPGFAEAHNHLGNMLEVVGDFDQAEQHFRMALEGRPDYAQAHYNLGELLLAAGAYAAGWRECLWRVREEHGTAYIRDPRNPRYELPLPAPIPGNKLAGRRILLLSDQGIGDEIFYLRYAVALRERGAWVAYRPSDRLAPLARRSGWADVFIEGDPLPEGLDHVARVTDAPILAGEVLERPPLPARLDQQAWRADQVAEELRAMGDGPYLGVTWEAGVKTERSLHKRIDPALIGGVLADWPGQLVVLQRNPSPGDIDAFSEAAGRAVLDLSASNHDLEEVLSVLASLDEYVGVSNTNMHLLAALGRQARVLVVNPPEWRWGLRGDASEWFPGFSLYREQHLEGWSTALSALRGDLSHYLTHSAYRGSPES